jgi:choline-glycine betaine transporter
MGAVLMAGIFILLVLSICLALLVLFLLLCYSDYRHLKQENNHFNRMVKEQFEMNSNSLNAYEAMLREACRSQAEEYEDEYEED